MSSVDLMFYIGSDWFCLDIGIIQLRGCVHWTVNRTVRPPNNLSGFTEQRGRGRRIGRVQCWRRATGVHGELSSTRSVSFASCSIDVPLLWKNHRFASPTEEFGNRSSPRFNMQHMCFIALPHLLLRSTTCLSRNSPWTLSFNWYCAEVSLLLLTTKKTIEQSAFYMSCNAINTLIEYEYIYLSDAFTRRSWLVCLCCYLDFFLDDLFSLQLSP